MAGMGDNPLVGDYTKGISKGPVYFAALENRIRREKANPKGVAADLQMGLFRDLNPLLASHVKRSGLGRFGPKKALESAPKSAVKGTTSVVVLAVDKDTKAVDNMSKNKRWHVASKQDLLLLKRQLCG